MSFIQFVIVTETECKILSACENSAEFPAESGCKANDLTRYKVDTTCRVLPYI